jgi:formylglycine-generating enzyme required for sulfatase activity
MRLPRTFGNGKKGEYRNGTIPVDSFDANPWGLYQVHGNVWEWCDDAYDKSHRVVRGGSWINDPDGLRSSDRYGSAPDLWVGDLGFRVARVVSPARTLLPP